MRALSAMKKEFLEILHDRTMLAVFIVFPVFVMIFMGSSFHSLEINGLPIGLAGPANTTFAGALFSGLNDSTAFKLQNFQTEGAAMDAFRNGQLRAVIIVPEDFEDTLRQGEGAIITIVVDNSDIALEQSVLAAMSSVVEASSADITKTYISAAWEDLQDLNSSAASLASEIESTRAQMLQTRAALSQVEEDMDNLDIGSLEGSLDDAEADVSALKSLIAAQKVSLQNASAGEGGLLNDTRLFLQNASMVLDESLATVQNAHVELQNQSEGLEDAMGELDLSIAGLEAIKAASTDPTIIAALDLNIDGLEALRDSTQDQWVAAQNQMGELEMLNSTLLDFQDSLEEYSDQVKQSASGPDRMVALEAALDEADSTLTDLDASFSGARAEISKLKSLLIEVGEATDEVDSTIDDALVQMGSFESLMGSLEDTVALQTGKDPDIIASPLSVQVQNQYGNRASSVDFIMPQVIAVSLLFSCFLLGSISFVREKTRKTIVRALMAPGSLVNLVIGKITTLVLLSLVQIIIIVAVAFLLFGVRPPADPLALLWGTAISALVLSSIGVIIGFFARSESAAIQSCLLLAIPMLFLGNIIFSPDLLPSYTRIIQAMLPLAHVTSIFRIVLITSGDPIANITALLSYFVLLAAILAYLTLWRKDITHYQ